MIDILSTGETTSHSEMLQNAKAALNTLVADLQKQQRSCDALVEIARQQNDTLEANQQRRAELLAGLQVAQADASKAEAARDLSKGTRTAHKRASAYEQATSAVSALQRELLALAGSDDQLRGEQEGTRSILQDANEALSRIQERLGIARQLVDEEEEAHRQEVKASWMEKLTSARQERDALKEQIAGAEAKVQQVQQGMVEALRPWPEYAQQVLDEVLEIAPYPSSQLLEAYLRLSELIEHHSQGLVRADPATLKALSVPIPTHVFAVSGPREAQREAYRRNYKSPGRAIDPQLWGYDSHLGEVEELRAQRQAEHRQAVIHELIWQGRE